MSISKPKEGFALAAAIFLGRPRKRESDQRGQVLVLAAVSMVVFVAMGALAVDLGMAFAARTAAQRAADSAALAGASAFLDYPHTSPRAIDTANARAMAFAISNDILADPIGEPQVTVWVIPDSQKVRVRIEETGLPTWFARVLNLSSLDVAAVSAAMASEGGASSQCLLPFAFPDLWDDMDDDNNPANEIPDGGEQWFFETGPEASDSEVPDRYGPFANNNLDATGFGSTFRDGKNSPDDIRRYRDYGRRLVLKSQEEEGGPAVGGSEGGGWTPATTGEVAPGNFQMWNMPDPERGCGKGTGGADWVWWNIDNCNTCVIELGMDYPIRPGDVESIKHPLLRLFSRDPHAHWVDDSNGGHVAGSVRNNPEQNSPLVRVVPIFSPEQNFHGQSAPIQFVNFAKIFIEPGNAEGTIYARFLGSVSGSSRRGSTKTGSLVKHLRLVE